MYRPKLNPVKTYFENLKETVPDFLGAKLKPGTVSSSQVRR